MFTVMTVSPVPMGTERLPLPEVNSWPLMVTFSLLPEMAVTRVLSAEMPEMEQVSAPLSSAVKSSMETGSPSKNSLSSPAAAAYTTTRLPSWLNWMVLVWAFSPFSIPSIPVAFVSSTWSFSSSREATRVAVV